MSLDFDVSTVKNYNVITSYPSPYQEGKSVWHPVTNALIWGTIAIGMNTITESNWEDFYNRLNIWEQCAGASLTRGDNVPPQKNYITPIEVYMHIGLHTNASSKTQAQFLKDCFETNKRYLETKDTAALYESVGIEAISAEEWNAAWTAPDTGLGLDTAGLIQEHRNKDVVEPVSQ